MLVFGLAQDVQANGTQHTASPIHAQNVPSYPFATLTPYEKVKVYLHASATNGMVVTEVSSDVCVVTFGGDITTVTVRYEPSTGNFVQV
ncbi:MAG: hypothetical protein OWR62_17045 [Sulfobacillus thermotolerans]|nr:hypothetical protein [Sulfobacillus thermotolerans]